MSLDVSLIVDEPVKIRGTGVFVRDNGKTVELSPDEVLDRWPDAEVTYTERETNEVFTKNITHNLSPMAKEAGLYKAIWRPDEIGVTHAKQLIPLLESDLKGLKQHPEIYKKMNPDNGWGDYKGLVIFADDYLAACKKYPDARVEVSR